MQLTGLIRTGSEQCVLVKLWPSMFVGFVGSALALLPLVARLSLSRSKHLWLLLSSGSTSIAIKLSPETRPSLTAFFLVDSSAGGRVVVDTGHGPTVAVLFDNVYIFLFLKQMHEFKTRG